MARAPTQSVNTASTSDDSLPIVNPNDAPNIGTQDGPPITLPTATVAVEDKHLERIQGVSPEDTERLRERAKAGLGLTDAAAALPEAIVTGPGEEADKDDAKK